MSNPASPGYYRPPVSPFGGVFTRPYFWDRFSVQTREAVCRAEWKGRRVTDPYELEGEYCPIGLALRLDGFIPDSKFSEIFNTPTSSEALFLLMQKEPLLMQKEPGSEASSFSYFYADQFMMGSISRFIHEWDRARIPVESLPGILGVTVEDPS
jgi:hypothetical protein